MVSLGELAVRFGCELRGDPDVRVGAIAPLARATPGTLSFLANPRLHAELTATHASAVVLAAASVTGCPVAALIAPNPHATFARMALLLHPPLRAPAGIHPSAVIAADATIDPSAHIAPLACVGARARIGARASVGAGSIVEDEAVLAEDVCLAARVVICRRVSLGARTLVHPGAVIGADGFGYAREQDGWLKVPQIGAVRVGCDVEIGANTAIDRGAIEDTIIGDGVKLDNHIQIGHNVHIGAHTAIAALVGISGSVTIGERCMIGGMVGIAGHLSICDDVVLTGMTLVSHSIGQPGIYSGAIPAEEASVWRRIVGRLKRIESLVRRLDTLERAAGSTTTRERKRS